MVLEKEITAERRKTKENTNMSDGITVPVTVGKMQNVTKGIQHSKKSVLYVNNKGHFHMVPEDMALNSEKNHRGHIIAKDHKDYMRGFKAATGYDENIKTDKFSQVAGKVQSVENVAQFDIKTTIAKEQFESEKVKKEGGVK